MSIVKRDVRFSSGFAVVILSLASFASTCPGQSILGVEFGAAQNTQVGTFTCNCGAAYNGGKGMGWDGSAFFELPIGPNFFAGLKAGLDRKNTSTTYPANAVEVVANASQLDTVSMPVNLTGNISLTLLSFEPFIQYQLLSSNFFIQVGAGISDLTSSNFTQTRERTSSSIKLSDGSTINNPEFTNGTRSETIQYGALTGENRLLVSGIFSAGYNLDLGRMNLAPIVTYDYPFSSPQSSRNWKIASLYGSLALGFKLN